MISTKSLTRNQAITFLTQVNYSKSIATDIIDAAARNGDDDEIAVYVYYLATRDRYIIDFK